MSADPDILLVVNAGSSSIKLALFTAEPSPTRVARATASGIGDARARLYGARAGGEGAFDEHASLPDHQTALARLLERIDAFAGGRTVVAAGHRIVHGGPHYTEPVRIDAQVETELRRCLPLAPLHLNHNLTGVAVVREWRAEIPQVACFDTAFHRHLPAVARETGLPRRFAEQGIRRYGFHGLSYEHVVAELRATEGESASAGRLVVAHLGAGASMAAVHGGRSVETTMGFSALEGLLMATRCGDVDPGVVLHLLRRLGMGAAEVERLLYEESGLLGVSGTSADMRVLLASDEATARHAVELFCYRARKHLGALAAVLGGLDRIVFTGGIGEHAPEVRARICAPLAWLGIELDEARNAAGARRVSSDASRVVVQVIPADEEAVIARHTVRLLGASGTA